MKIRRRTPTKIRRRTRKIKWVEKNLT